MLQRTDILQQKEEEKKNKKKHTPRKNLTLEMQFDITAAT